MRGNDRKVQFLTFYESINKGKWREFFWVLNSMLFALCSQLLAVCRRLPPNASIAIERKKPNPATMIIVAPEARFNW